MSAAPTDSRGGETLDRRLAPTAGVRRLFVEALVDLLLLPARVLHAVVTARRRKAEMAELILTDAREAKRLSPSTSGRGGGRAA